MFVYIYIYIYLIHFFHLFLLDNMANEPFTFSHGSQNFLLKKYIKEKFIARLEQKKKSINLAQPNKKQASQKFLPI